MKDRCKFANANPPLQWTMDGRIMDALASIRPAQTEDHELPARLCHSVTLQTGFYGLD